MIKSFGVENFKAFKDKVELDLKPLTILTGTNSSGKSSFSQAMRLINSCKINAFSTINQASLEFKNEFSILGDYGTIRNNEERNISFSLPLKFPGIDNYMRMEFTFQKSEDKKFADGELTMIKVVDFTYEEAVDVFVFEDNGYSEVQVGDDSYPFRDMKRTVNVSFLKDEFDKLVNRIKQTQNSIRVIIDYLRLTNDEKLISSSEAELQDFFDGREIPNNVKESFEILKAGKEFYINGDDYETAVINDTKQTYYSPGNLNDLFVLTGEKEEVFKISSNKSNFIEVLKYDSDKPLLNYIFRNGQFSETELEEIKLIEANFIFNKQNTSEGAKVYHLDFEKESMFSSLFESKHGFVKDEIHAIVTKKFGLPDVELDVELGDNFNIFLNGFVNKGIENCFTQIDKNFFTKDIEYIPSIRAIPSRFISRNNLATYLDSLIDKLNTTNPSDMINLNKWVKEFKIADGISIENFGSTGVSQIALIKGQKKINLTDVGYGVSQLLPILIRLCLFNDKIVIVEEPETNLHPALQSKLADFFVSQTKNNGKTIIIETHSEYLIRRLQVLISKKQVDNEKTIVHYFYPPNDVPNGEDQIKTIRFEENGIMSGEFGRGFTDEANNSSIQLFQLTKGQYN